MPLSITKPIIFIDIEGTGLSITKDRIVEICFMKLNPDGSRETQTHRLNPEMPIPQEVIKIHGICDDDVCDAPTFKQKAKEFFTYIGNADLSGFNILRYDLPILMEEFLRVNLELDLSKRKVIDVQKIFHTMEKRTLEAAYSFYCGKDHIDSHSAEGDTIATFEVLEAQLERYEQLKNTVDDLDKFLGQPTMKMVDLEGRMLRRKDGKEIFNFGKHKGKCVEDVFNKEPNYYDWMMNGTFSAHTKKKLTEIRMRMQMER